MSTSINRRLFLALPPMLLSGSVLGHEQTSNGVAKELATFPFHDRDLVRDTVSAAHGNLDRVKALVSARPALACASWDWGFGDHESAIDAASHVGNRPIAELLIGHGARPTIFTMAMLGDLTAVKSMIGSLPGVQRQRGPHGITLLAHARAGGPAAAGVLRYLEQLGDADPRYPDVPIPEEVRKRLSGDFAFGTGETDRFRVAVNARGQLTIARPGVMIERMLFHHGDLVFNPAGAAAVTIRFQDDLSRLLVRDADLEVAAQRV